MSVCLCVHIWSGRYLLNHSTFFFQVPPSPLANEENEDKYVVVTAEDCTPTGDREELFTQLEQDLIKQIRVSNLSLCVYVSVCVYVWTFVWECVVLAFVHESGVGSCVQC